MQVKRFDHFDNARALLVFFVIFVHIIAVVVRTNDVPNLISVYKFCNFFIMPSIIFISGYFAKKGLSLTESVSRYFAPLIVFHVIFTSVNHLLNLQKDGFHFRDFLATPFHALWYLLSMFYWSILLNFVNDKYLKQTIFLSLFIAVFAGTISFIGHYLALSRTLYFFPFFLLGYWSRTSGIKNFSSTTSGQTFLSILFLILMAFVSVKFGTMFHESILWGNRSFSHIGISNFSGILFRVVVLILSGLSLVCFFKLVPTKNTRLTAYGAKTFQIYLLHEVTIRLLLYANIRLTIESEILIILIITMVSAATFYLTSFEVFGNLVKNISLATKGFIIRFPYVENIDNYLKNRQMVLQKAEATGSSNSKIRKSQL